MDGHGGTGGAPPGGVGVEVAVCGVFAVQPGDGALVGHWLCGHQYPARADVARRSGLPQADPCHGRRLAECRANS